MEEVPKDDWIQVVVKIIKQIHHFKAQASTEEGSYLMIDTEHDPVGPAANYYSAVSMGLCLISETLDRAAVECQRLFREMMKDGRIKRFHPQKVVD